MAGGFTARWAALVAAAAIVLHGTRFALHPVEGAEAHGHLRLLVAGVVAGLLACAWRWSAELRAGGDASALRPRLVPLWIATSVIVLGAFAGQETAELLLAPDGHGLHGLTGEGAWLLPVMAAGLGLGVALLLRGAQAALVRAALRALHAHRGPSPLPRRPIEAPVARRAPLAHRLAGRGPPPGRPAAACS